MFTVASIVSVAPVQPYLFRNYQYPEPPPGYNPGGYPFRRMGSCKHGLWQSVRASSAAPYYLEDYAHENERCVYPFIPTPHPPILNLLSRLSALAELVRKQVSQKSPEGDLAKRSF